MTTVLEKSASGYSAEVEDFATEHQVLDCVPKLMEVVAELFPAVTAEVELQRDPDIDGLAWIVFSVDETGLQARGIHDVKAKWREACEAICPNPDAASCFTLQVRG